MEVLLMDVRMITPACVVMVASLIGGCVSTKADSSTRFCDLTRAHVVVNGNVTIEANAMLTPNYDILLGHPECSRSGALLFIPDALSGDASVKRLTTELAPTWSSGQHVNIIFEGTFIPGKAVGEPNAFVLRRILAVLDLAD
jgi:hypothetical protein